MYNCKSRYVQAIYKCCLRLIIIIKNMFTQDDCVSLEKLLSMQFVRIKIQLKKLKGNTKNYLIYYKYELRLTINALHAFGSFKASGI